MRSSSRDRQLVLDESKIQFKIGDDALEIFTDRRSS